MSAETKFVVFLVVLNAVVIGSVTAMAFGWIGPLAR